MPMTYRALVTVALALFALPAHAQDVACGIGHLATIEPDGSVRRGSKERLRRAAAGGVPLRVGWAIDANNDGADDLVHWADAAFVTVFEGEVFAQIDDIQRQVPTRGEPRVIMPAGRQRWSGLVGTTGRLEGHFDDGSEPTSARVRSMWCIDPRTATCAPGWRLVYRHDADGHPMEGSLQALLDAIRRGAGLRVAWGFASGTAAGADTVEHVAEPVFVTIMNGEHVFAQLPEQIGQASYTQPEGARFERPSVMWRRVMGTDGTFDAVFVDRATGEEVRRLTQHAGLSWFAELSGTECDSQGPLRLAVPNGVRHQ